MGLSSSLFCKTGEEIMDLSLQEDTILFKESFVSFQWASDKKSFWVMQIFIALPWELWDHWLISPGSTSHHRDMRTTHISSFFITPSPPGSTCCDSIGGRLVEIAAWQQWLIDWRTDGGRASLLPQPFPVSYKILFFFCFFLLLSFSFLFPFSSGGPLSDGQVSGNFKMVNSDLSALK